MIDPNNNVPAPFLFSSPSLDVVNRILYVGGHEGGALLHSLR